MLICPCLMNNKNKMIPRAWIGTHPYSISFSHRFERVILLITVESQKDYHARRKHHHSRMTTAKTTTAAIASTTRSSASTTATTAVEQSKVEDNQIPEVTKWPTTEPTETWEITTTTISTTPSTTTTTTPTPREWIVQTYSMIINFLCNIINLLRNIIGA